MQIMNFIGAMFIIAFVIIVFLGGVKTEKIELHGLIDIIKKAQSLEPAHRKEVAEAQMLELEAERRLYELEKDKSLNNSDNSSNSDDESLES